ncbi:type I restriction endonuclease subunit R [Acinetobacter sp. CWB-G5]|uniref:type I restriction endonuclease subunit R n=1 Tax=Acinetobacter sp. CWB-G5 TaxID=2855444 RepID=UPI001C44E214|nr:type I restriction endonuclease subunit R [Acinetobacter sp. CWB-G5]MBV7309878.1 type I restriction endonuclease subunit R [Acinetobacter sp. CWB-G5]
MVSLTNERALEMAIEKVLTGTCLENIKAGLTDIALPHNGFVSGSPANFDMLYVLDTQYFWQFLEQTQSDELAKIQKFNPHDWQRKIYERFDRMIRKHGVVHLLKKGLAVDQAHFQLMYPAPLASSSQKIKDRFKQNIFSVTRQLRYSKANPLQEIDMVVFVNGIPIITFELKNEWTGQNARHHGQKQYKQDRDITQPLLSFARCIVHMAVDTDEVYMTTKLDGANTLFLPFNKGHNAGAGNPPNEEGHKTAYLWKELLSKESLANIIQHFVRLDGDEKTLLDKRNLYFPRYHQLSVVRRLIHDVSINGVGQTYLIQHSAGSGKSNSITWAAFQLIEAYCEKESVAGSRGLEHPLFDSVIVVTDRRILDKQLKENIKEFSEVKNIMAHAHKSSELKSALENGKKIIITTIQKFPFIIDGIADLSDKRFAVIIDEAHSSQSGVAHNKMNEVMGKANEDSDGVDAQDKILSAMLARKMKGNASYFAFTATPKNTTLEKFGEKQADGSFKPFDLYSMKQAIEEGFILDVLSNYTTYKSFYEIEKSILDNPLFDTKKAQKTLRSYVEKTQQTIDIKAEVMFDHFIQHVVNTKKLKGKAKGMIVTQNIESAIRYYKAIDRLLEQAGYPFKPIIAFSGEKKVDGIEYTESILNGFSDNDTKDMFDRGYVGEKKPAGVNVDQYRLLIVANKYLTGFDQPKLCTMYVDKKLADVLCVQALSRLNRSAPKLGKRTEDLFVLDFFNEIEDIKQSFDRFYTSTTLSQATDINVLNELTDELDAVGVYESSEVEDFATKYFDSADAEKLSPIIDVAVARFDSELELSAEDKADFKIKAKQFVKIYGQMASILPYEVPAWEKLYWFLKFLIPKLKIEDPEADALDELLNSVDLNSYGLQRKKLNQQIELDSEETILDPTNSNPRGAHGGEIEEDPLDEIIKTFNERWFGGWAATPEEQKVKFVNILKQIKEHADFESKYLNNLDPHTKDLAFDKILNEVMLRQRKVDMDMYKQYSKDTAFRMSWKYSLQQGVMR